MKKIYKKLFLSLIALSFIGLVSATVLTPIARVDVVPHQRISQGETFNFGVVAFSKNGIDRVEFTISGQGYSGGMQQSASMTYNPRTDVYEYWVPISAASFSSSGEITVNAKVYGKDGGTRDLGATPLIVTPNNSLAQPKAWISNNGNDATGELGNQGKPYQTIVAAITAIQSANGGSSNGAIIYLEEGSYTIGSGTTTTSNEWFTITKTVSAGKDNVIITGKSGSAANTSLIRYKEVSIVRTSTVEFDYVLEPDIDYMWLDGCKIQGPGRGYFGGARYSAIRFANPIANRAGKLYYTKSEVFNCFFGISQSILSRNNYIHTLSDDAHQNDYCIINDRVDDLDRTEWINGSSGEEAPHTDIYELFVTPNIPSPENRIIYGMEATNCESSQGIFCRPSSDGNPPKTASNIAFVNNLLGPGEFNSFQGIWDHLLIWHNTFIGRTFSIYKDTRADITDVFSFTNSSMVGNYFESFNDSYNGHTFDLGNTYNNEAINNHFYHSYEDGYSSDNRLHSPDTETPHTDTYGTLELDLTDPVNFVNYGYPSSDTSVLINRLPAPKVPADIFGNPRGASADVGAIEFDENLLTHVTSVTIFPDTLEINVLQTAELTDSVAPANASKRTVTWSSSNDSIVTVDANGIITAIREGNATIIVTTVDGGLTDSCAVRVTNNNVPATGVSVSPSSLKIGIGRMADLISTVSPADATNQSVTWSTSNAFVATVDSSGLVTGIAEGSAFIIATTNDGEFSDTCKVGVTTPLIDEDFSVGASNFTVTAGGTWSVIDGRYVMVSTASGGVGLMGNMSLHNTTVTGNFTLTTLINLTGTSSAWNDASVLFNYQDNSNYYYVSLNESNDESTQGIFIVIDGVATELCDITATISSDTDYKLGITITGSDIVVTLDGVQVATATDASITGGKVGYGSKNDAAKFDNLLVLGPVPTIPVTGVIISADALGIAIGQTSSLKATVTPANATDLRVSWSSSDTSVATVDVNGLVMTVSPGNALITVTTNDGGFVKTCAVTVSPPLIDEDFSANASNFTVTAGGTWSVVDGRYVLVSTASGGIGLMGNMSIQNTNVTGNFTLTTLINLTGTSSAWNDASVLFNYQDNDNYYYVSLNESNDPTTQGLFKVVDGVAIELCDITTAIISDTDYNLGITVTGNDIVVTLDGIQVATATDAGVTGGKVGYGSKNDAAKFDNLLVITSQATGIKELKRGGNITVFPNPLRAGSQLNIALKQYEDILGIRIYDVNGRIHYINTKIDKNVIEIPNNLKPGLYVVNVQTLHTTEDFKLIITQ